MTDAAIEKAAAEAHNSAMSVYRAMTGASGIWYGTAESNVDRIGEICAGQNNLDAVRLWYLLSKEEIALKESEEDIDGPDIVLAEASGDEPAITVPRKLYLFERLSPARQMAYKVFASSFPALHERYDREMVG